MKKNYFTRKKENAKRALDNLRDFYDEGLDVWGMDDSLRSVISYQSLNSRTGDENYLKSMRKIKKNMDDSFGWWSAHGFWEKAKKADGLEIEEKKKVYFDFLKERYSYELSNKFYNLLEKWVEKAQPILKNLIEEDPKKFEDFEYYLRHSGGAYGAGNIYGRLNFEGENLDKTEFSFYGDKTISYSTEKIGDYESLSRKILESIDTNNLMGPRRDRRDCGWINSIRSEIVKNVELKTGINLKEELKNLE